ncbi:unnamed protein product, partial [Closterium sp. Naga37s-1]
MCSESTFRVCSAGSSLNSSCLLLYPIQNEITTVEGVQHPNIVRLLACCTEKVKALVYEFIPMGDVDAWLAKCAYARGSDGKAKFSWADRMKVIMGTAEAMTFIHKQRFIHRDFKSSNVLLTEDFTPKVADFGLAKGIEDWKTHVTTRVMGSMGYIDPTYFESGHLCDKSDVFAFGLFMVEILAGKSVLRQGFAEDIKAWLYEADAPTAADMMDLAIINEANKTEASAIAIIAKQSTAREWADRPTMEEVLEVLKVAIKLPVPNDEPKKTSNYPVKRAVGAGFPEYTYDEMMLITDRLKKPIGQGGFGTSNYPVKRAVGAGFPEYTYDEMMLITDRLKKPIGQGGFGVVYKGYLQDPAAVAAAAAAAAAAVGGGGEGQGGAEAAEQVLVAVAVKVLDNEDVELKDDEQFHAELMAMEQLSHPTILSLYGYVAKPTPALIYEFITNGNAEAYLRRAVQGKAEFSWKARLRVALMCAEALQVMHSHNYVHRDFKASNVLLREDLTPVLADFGLARTVNNWQSHVTTRVMGSTGYIDPVYFESGHLNAKCDTYAFGIFLLELVTGMLVTDKNFEALRMTLATGADLPEADKATAYSVRDRLIESWNDTQQYFKDQDSKRVYYLSMEFLMGRSLLNSIFNLGMKDQYVEALGQLGYKLEVLAEQERDAALGNGGLGRLAACVLDSMATLNYPGWGYGIRYQYGMFRQTLQDGFQHEQPDYWLTFGNPWEIERVFVTYPVRFYGTVESYTEAGHPRKRWVEGETVEAVAYDNPIPGYHTNNTINLRLWGAKPSGEFDLQSFNTGDYVNAILSKQKAEAISSVLYPDDRTYQGKELRLKQQHFFVSATMQDVVRRYKEEHTTFDEFKDKVALQLNDTHPVLALVELMRLLVDEEGLEWGYAWNITSHTFSYTNHTVLPEALEKWPVEILEALLPRHLEIMYEINHNFIVDLKKRIGNDYDRLSRMSIIEEGAHKSIRMATLAVVTCHTINGVSQIHTDLIQNTLFKDFYDIWPHKFQNKTNGVTQRRWLAFCNPGLAGILTQWLGTESWITNLDLVAGLKEHVDDPLLQTQWMQVRRQNKARLAAYIEGISGIKVSIDAMFDVQVKRIHEYKRQLLNVMSIIHRYDCIKKMSPEDRKRVVPRVCLLGGKAAPGYDLAKKIVKLISAVSEVINNDEDVGDLLKLDVDDLLKL